MFANSLVIYYCLIISFGVNVFVTVGKYPDYQKFGINQQTCGLTIVPTIYEISFPEKCFKNKLKTIKVLEAENTQRRDDSDVAKRIYNGRDVESGESPWTVHLNIFMFDKWKGGFKTSCSCVLIALNWLLTAAHCLETNENIASFWIHAKAGEKKGRQISVAKNQSVFMNLSYVNGSDHKDVALIKLDNSFKQIDNKRDKYLINTICLPESGQTNLEEEIAFSYGFGYIIWNIPPKYLQKMEVTLKPFQECEEFFCANITGNQPRTCIGHSGGPLIQFLSNNRKRAVLIVILHGGEHPIHKIGVPCGPGPKINQWIAVPNVFN